MFIDRSPAASRSLAAALALTLTYRFSSSSIAVPKWRDRVTEARPREPISSFTTMAAYHMIHVSHIWRAARTRIGDSVPMPTRRAIHPTFVKRAP
jgi:hypothetical protein